MYNSSDVKISVAMATYNGERFLREQLDSLYGQTRVPDEIVVCDDRSTDGTVAILEEYKQKFGLRYYVNENSLGVNKNFYKAISLCEGDYVCLSDQDDVWMPHKIEKTLAKMLQIDDGRPCAVSSRPVDVDAECNVIGEIKAIPDSWGYEATLLTEGLSQGCSLMLNKSLKDKIISVSETYPDTQKMYFDGLISFTAAILGQKYNIGEQLMYYRHHSKNVVNKYHQKKDSFIKRLPYYSTYYGLMSDNRIRSLSTLYYIYINDNLSKDVRSFLQDVMRLGEKRNILSGLFVCCGFKELSLFRKVYIVLSSLLLCLLKICILK